MAEKVNNENLNPENTDQSDTVESREITQPTPDLSIYDQEKIIEETNSMKKCLLEMQEEIMKQRVECAMLDVELIMKVDPPRLKAKMEEAENTYEACLNMINNEEPNIDNTSEYQTDSIVEN